MAGQGSGRQVALRDGGTSMAAQSDIEDLIRGYFKI